MRVPPLFHARLCEQAVGVELAPADRAKGPLSLAAQFGGSLNQRLFLLLEQIGESLYFGAGGGELVPQLRQLPGIDSDWRIGQIGQRRAATVDPLDFAAESGQRADELPHHRFVSEGWRTCYVGQGSARFDCPCRASFSGKQCVEQL